MSTPYVGEIRMFGFNRMPTGWQACNGSLLPISQYDVLFALIGTTYGGDGQNTFGVPDLRGRLPIHQGQGPGLSNYVIGQVAGTETVSLNAQQMSSHIHTVLATTAAATTGNISNTVIPGAVSGETLYATDITGGAPFTTASSSMTPAGNSQPHSNIMPTLTVQYCIAVEGIFPQQS